MTWMSRVNGQVEVDRGWMVWKLRVRPIGSTQKCDGQEDEVHVGSLSRMGRKLLGARNTVAGVAEQGDLGCRKLAEHREEMKVMFGKRLAVLEEGILVKN